VTCKQVLLICKIFSIVNHQLITMQENDTQWSNRRKAVCKSVFFGNIALYFKCRINKNALL